MRQSQIFISYSHQNHPFAYKIYDELLSAEYWVWMDERLKPAEKWEPQIEENLRKSETFIALISSHAVVSEWVKHEGSMAYALGWHIIPVQIEPFGKYTSKQLPMWAAKLQLHTLFEGSADYDDKFQELKQLLGTPLPIRQYIEEMLVHFQNSHVLLDDVGLALVERHYHELHLPKDKKELADKLIRESRRKKLDYLKRYDALQDDYEQEQQENDRLKKKIEKMGTDRIIDVGAFTVLTIIILSFLLYLFLLLKGVL